MNWLQFLSAVGVGGLVGGIVVKIIDIVWLQKVVRDSEKSKWMREQRVRVFSELASCYLTHGFVGNLNIETLNDTIEKTARAMLFIPEKNLNRINEFQKRLGICFFKYLKFKDGKLTYAEVESAVHDLNDSGRDVVANLRSMLLES